MLAWTGALFAGSVVSVLVVSVGTSVHADPRERIEEEARCTGSSRAVVTIVPSHAVADTAHTKSVLGAPVGTGLPGPYTELVEIRTGEVSGQCGDGLLGG